VKKVILYFVTVLAISAALYACGNNNAKVQQKQPVKLPAFEEDVDSDYLGGISLIEHTTDIQYMGVDPDRAPQWPTSYDNAKKLMYHNISDTQSLYCGCDTVIDGSDERFHTDNCNFVPSNPVAPQATRLEAEHVLPAELIATYGSMSCWDGPDCRNKETNRRCCYRSDALFKRAFIDLVNLYPAIGSVNLARLSKEYDDIPGEEYNFGQCNFEYNSEYAEPREEVQGDVARIYYYMADNYSLTLPSRLLDLLEVWDQNDPVDEIELERNNLILEIQGSSNPYVF